MYSASEKEINLIFLEKRYKSTIYLRINGGLVDFLYRQRLALYYSFVSFVNTSSYLTPEN